MMFKGKRGMGKGIILGQGIIGGAGETDLE